MSLMVACSTLTDKVVSGPCLQGTCIFRSDVYAGVVRMESLSVPSEKTSPLHFDESLHGCDHPAPPLQCWRLWYTVLKQEWNDFFAPRNLSPLRLNWQPTLHCLGVWGSSVAKAEETFFRSGLECDDDALLSSDVCPKLMILKGR